MNATMATVAAAAAFAERTDLRDPAIAFQGNEEYAQRNRPDDCQQEWYREKVTKDQSDDDRQRQYDVRNRPAVRNSAADHREFREDAYNHPKIHSCRGPSSNKGKNYSPKMG